MNPRQRTARFERLKHLDEQRLDRLAENARAAAARLEGVRTQLSQLSGTFAQEFQQAASLDPGTAQQLVFWAQRRQLQVQTAEKRLQVAGNELREAQEAVRQQQSRIRVWEKLLKGLAERIRADQETRDGRIADELFLQRQIKLQSGLN